MTDLEVSVERNRLLRGALAGLAGGVVFGMLMAMMDMMPMVGALVGVPSAAVGWIVHLVISLGVGLAFGAVVAAEARGRAVVWGVAAGLAMWVGGAMVIMRLALGMPIALDTTALMSMMGHVVFGVVLGLTYAGLAARFPAAKPRAASPHAVLARR